MDYRDFKEEFVEALKEDLYQKGTEVRSEDKAVEKLNGEGYDAVVISPVDSKIGVTLNVEPYFEAFQDGVSMDDVVA